MEYLIHLTFIITIGLITVNLLYMPIIIKIVTSSVQQNQQNYGMCYEHLFFINCDNLGLDELNDLLKFTVDDIEPHFVRNDNKLPCKNHMYSYISFIIITRNKPSEEVINKIKNSNIVKHYMFGARGYSTVRLVCVTPSQYSIVANKYGKDISEHLNNMMLHNF